VRLHHPVFLAAACFPAVLSLAACHSYRIDAVVENRTGEKIELLEVDYPSASFGVDALASGAAYHYRFQVRGSGPVKVQYTESGSVKVRQAVGPSLYEHEEGSLEIVLLPDGKAEFHPQLSTHP
jgi:hypothetical protein